MIQLKIISQVKDREEFFLEGTLLSAADLSLMLFERTNLKHTVYYGNSYYVYSEEEGYYKRYSEYMLELAIVNHLKSFHISFSKKLIQTTLWLLERGWGVKGDPFVYRYVSFSNGILDLDTYTLHPWTPEVFCTVKLPGEYKFGMMPTRFKEFLSESINPDTLEFIRAVFWTAIRGENRSQVIIYFYGPGGTGKSTLVNALRMVAGEGGSVTTSLRDLNQNPFETLNLAGRRLICIRDTDDYQGDTSVLKAITGGDTVVGRVKHQSGGLEISSQGLVVMTGNQMLQSRDSSGALLRRMRVIKMDRVLETSSQKTLLYRSKGEFKGPLSKECVGIINWARMGHEKGYTLLTDYTKTPSIAASIEDYSHIVNPMKAWVERLQPSGKSYIGYLAGKMGLNDLIHFVRSEKTLYPAYLIHCHKLSLKPVNHIQFTLDLEMICLSLGIRLKKKEDKFGIYVEGLSLHTQESILDAPSIAQKEAQDPEPVNDILTKDGKINCTLGHEKAGPDDGYPKPLWVEEHRSTLRWETRNKNLYDDYMRLLRPTRLKQWLNIMAKGFDPDIEGLLEEFKGPMVGLKFLGIREEPSQKYLDRTKEHFVKEIKTVQNIVPFEYKAMGMSPRILPLRSGHTINSARRFVRYKAYEFVISKAKGYSILDINLNSCYTSILIGLFPRSMPRVRQAIEGPGLWKAFEQEFKASGHAGVFNKPSIKICVYSSFLMGEPHAMVNGTLEFMRKDIGITKAQFKRADYYKDLYSLAQKVSKCVNETELIKDFRSISNRIRKDFDGQYIKGPTDHQYMIDEAQFMTSYPNFLQSFEFFLLAQGTINAIMKVPKAELIGHYHGGNVIIIPTSMIGKYMDTLNSQLKDLGSDLQLGYPQIAESQIIGPTDKE